MDGQDRVRGVALELGKLGRVREFHFFKAITVKILGFDYSYGRRCKTENQKTIAKLKICNFLNQDLCNCIYGAARFSTHAIRVNVLDITVQYWTIQI